MEHPADMRELLAAALIASTCASASAQAPSVPEGYAARAEASPPVVVRDASIKPLWMTGLAVFPASYVLTFAIASVSTTPDYWAYSYVPLAGPWVMLGLARNDEERAGAVLGGATQALGILLFVLGVTLRQPVREAAVALAATPLPGGGRLDLGVRYE
ncbi:MAG: hypothetical protein K8H88_17910 [Sandaracinaceae bacterium]|nr:hypothetical protein [Sandaracinaceae bacterium]